MGTSEIVATVVLFILTLTAFVIGIRQFSQRGFCFNNAYIYASEEEREKMDKKPYYKQSGTVFIFIGVIFLLNGIEVIVKTGWLFYAAFAVMAITVVFALISSVKIEKRNKKS